MSGDVHHCPFGFPGIFMVTVRSRLGRSYPERAVGLAFKAVLYKTENLCDCVWNGRPEWARPAVGGIAGAAAGHPQM